MAGWPHEENGHPPRVYSTGFYTSKEKYRRRRGKAEAPCSVHMSDVQLKVLHLGGLRQGLVGSCSVFQTFLDGGIRPPAGVQDNNYHGFTLTLSQDSILLCQS